MKIAVVFDTPYVGWEDEDFKAAMYEGAEEAEYEVAEALLARDHEVLLVGIRDDFKCLCTELRAFEPDLVFNCAEGFCGNSQHDYLFATLLEIEGYHYTGAPPIALLTTRNKAMSKKILAYHGIRVPRFEMYRQGELITDPTELSFPLLVKPLQEDASEGIATASVVADTGALRERVQFVHQRFAQPAIAEEFVEGRELYVSILGNDAELQMLPLVEMTFDKDKTRPEERIATKLAKWDVPYRERKGIRNQFARPVSRVTRERLEECCRTAFRALWLRDYARLDVRLADDDEVWVIEVNANPFLGFGHDTANAAEKAGMDYYAFVQRIVDDAVARYGTGD